jgi:hypothetical protein
MSTAATPPPAAATAAPHGPQEIRLFSHSNLFYWWPVWLLGLVLGLLTLFSHEYMVVVPSDAEASRKLHYIPDPAGAPNKVEVREGIVLKPSEDLRKRLPPNTDKEDLASEPELRLHATSHKAYGAIFATVLLVVIFITNVPLRGMWSLLIIMAIIMLSIIFGLAGWWDRILGAIRLLDIRINMGGYFFISLGLLGLWTFAFFFFDKQVYIVFTPGAMKVCMEIGAGEKQYDTFGMTIEREKSDLFRHYILGLGSGDLVVRTSGADRHEFRLTNVLFVKHKLAQIEDMQRMRQQHGP